MSDKARAAVLVMIYFASVIKRSNATQAVSLVRRIALVLIAFAGLSSSAWAQSAAPSTPGTASELRNPSVKTPQAPGVPAKTPESAKPGWAELTVAQRQTLAPLAGAWSTINAAQKRKWLALSANYPKLPAAERSTMDSRMSDWAALSPQQRTQARLNFADTKQLAPDDKKAKWEAYQALPPEEKRKLAAGAPARVPGTAAALKPVSPQRLVTTPSPGRDARTPRIAAGSSAEAGFPAPPAGPGSPQDPLRSGPN